MKETDKAYLAGLIDSDGCIGLMHRKSTKLYKKTGRREYHYYIPQVSVAQKKKECILFLLRFIEGSYCQSYRSNGLYYWTRIYRQDQVAFLLEMILPYLLIKRRQATALLTWLEYRKNKIYEHNKEGRYIGNYGEVDRVFKNLFTILNRKNAER